MTATAEELATQAAKPQPQSFDLTNGRDEMNLAEFPLFYLGQRIPANLKTLRYEHSVYDAASNRHHTRKLEIAGSDAYGLPTVLDADVLLALLLLSKQRTDFESRTVSFTFYELIEILGWTHGGTNYKRLKNSLRKWKTITLFFDNGWWDKKNEKWETEGFSILDHIGTTESKETGKAQGSCTFNEHFFASLQSGNIRKLNLAEWFSLEYPTAKQMYRFLGKRFYKRSRIEFDLREFAYEHIGLSRNYAPSKLKEKLKPAIEELVAIGFICDLPKNERYTKVSHGEWKIHFTRTKSKLIETTLTGSKSERSAARLLIKRLTDHGMTAATAQSVVSDKSIPNDLIIQKIEMLEWYLAEKPETAPKQKGGWLMKAIREDYSPPSEFKTKEQREAEAAAIAKAKKERAQREALKKQHEEQQREEAEARHKEKWDAITAYLNGLSQEQREQCLEDMIDQLPAFSQKGVRKDLKKGFDGMFIQAALMDYIPKLMDTAAAS